MEGRLNVAAEKMRRVKLFFALVIVSWTIAERGRPADIHVSGLVASTNIDQSGVLRLTLWNRSEKVITAYKLTWSEGTIREQELDLIGTLASPGNPGRVFRPSKSLSLDDPFGPYIRPRDVVVTGVVYEDNSWEGEPGFQRVIFAFRRQHVFAIEKFVLPLLGPGRPEDVEERMRIAISRSERSGSAEESSAAQYLRTVAQKLSELRGLPSEEATKRISAMMNEEEAMLRLLKGHMYPQPRRD
jgi:hypothetical protein